MWAGCNQQFLNAFVTKLRPVFLMPGEEVFKKGDLSRELGLVLDGACTVMSDKKVRGPPLPTDDMALWALIFL